MLDFCLADSIILSFWYVLESIHKFIIELHALQSLSVRRCNKKQRRCRILQISQKERFFLLLWQSCALGGNLTTRLPFLDPPIKAFLSPSVCSRSTVYIGVSIPPQKLPPPLSWQAPFKSANCSNPHFYTIPPLYCFFEKTPF